jgi:hypothetical protein
MNSRRLIASPEGQDEALYRLKLAQRKGSLSDQPMSALGQKQTFAVQNRMSALPPKADMCGATRDVRYGPTATAIFLREVFC